MTENPKQDPIYPEPEQPQSQPQEETPQAGELDELRKNLSLQGPDEKGNERPGLLRKAAGTLTGTLNRLIGAAPEAEQRVEAQASGDTAPEQPLEEHFDHVLPPLVTIPAEESETAFEWSDDEAEAFDAIFSQSREMPFDTTLDQTDLDVSALSGENAWSFEDRPSSLEGESTITPNDEMALPTIGEPGDEDGGIETKPSKEKVDAPEKPHGWRSRVTGFLGINRAPETADPTPELDLDEEVLTSRLGLTGVLTGGDQAEPPAAEEDNLLPTEELPIAGQPEGELPWYEQRGDILVEDMDEPASQGFGLPPQPEEADIPAWAPFSEDLLQNLQAEREEMLEEAEGEPAAQTEDFFAAGPFDYRGEYLDPASLEDDNVSDYWSSVVEDAAPAGWPVEPEPAPAEEAPAESASMEDVSLESLRGVALEEYGAADTRGAAAGQPDEESGWMGFSRTQTIILGILAIVGMTVVAMGILLQLSRMGAAPVQQGAAVQQQVDVIGGPQPTGVELPGGWYINLNPSTMVDGKWLPAGAEWLRGSEIRRVVALPWSRQMEAVIVSLVPGDTLTLSFSNAKSIQYQVDKVERITAESTSQLQELSPSLLVVLSQEDSTDRWLVTCTPVDIE